MHRSENPATADAESKAAAKYYTEVAATLTPMSKAMSTESANQICYDNIQIHGGTGYMHDFDSERLYRDVRITNIYEGTTQLQVVAAIGGVMKRSLDKMMNELFDAIPETDFTSPLKAILKKEYDMQHEAVNFITEKKDPDYHNLRARSMVENETFLFVGLLLLRDALKDADREAVTERYILDGEKDFERNYKLVMSDDRSVMEKHRSIIDY